MSDVAALIADLVRAGVDPDLVGRTAAALASREPVKVVDEQAERKRAADRERTRARRGECSEEEWLALRAYVFHRDGYRCVYCGDRPEVLHCDHVVPFSKGGRSEPSNLVASCAPCNISKGARSVEEWRASWA